MTGTQLDLVLVNPGSRARIYQSLGAKLTAVENPVWAGLIASFVRRKGFSVEIVDAEADELSPEEAAERVAVLRPRLAAGGPVCLLGMKRQGRRGQDARCSLQNRPP